MVSCQTVSQNAAQWEVCFFFLLHKRILFSGQIPVNNACHRLILLTCGIRYALNKVYSTSQKAIQFGLGRVKENFKNLCSLIEFLKYKNEKNPKQYSKMINVTWDYGNPLQDPGLGNPLDRGAWYTMVQRFVKSQT